MMRNRFVVVVVVALVALEQGSISKAGVALLEDVDCMKTAARTRKTNVDNIVKNSKECGI
jgi:hypothetical protein